MKRKCQHCTKSLFKDEIHVEVEEHGFYCIACFFILFNPLDWSYA